MLEFITANKVYIGIVLGVIVVLWPRLAASLSKVKSMFVSKTDIDFEIEDQNAIRHLRKRAVSIEDKDLITMIKAIDGKFYDTHTGGIK